MKVRTLSTALALMTLFSPMTVLGKQGLIKKSYRPPNYETPIEYLNDIFTPNDKFFVRYHLAAIPVINAQEWKLQIGGDSAEKPFVLTLDQLKHDFEQVEIVALAYCSGNRRGLFQPHVPGVQWSYGAMGNARWKGVRLRDILKRAGIKGDAVEVVFDGADGPVSSKTPDFVKSLPVDKAVDENTIIAYEMNGEPLPQLQGYPARLVVPGWTATYWMKHLISIQAVSKPFDGFWMKKAYRIPKNRFPGVEGNWTSQATEENTPITEIIVNSLITNIHEGQKFSLGKAVQLQGMAWDGGHGIKRVEISTDGGHTWSLSDLGKDYGRFSWRQFKFPFQPGKPGKYVIIAKSTNGVGQTQSFELIPNPAGYHHNQVQQINVSVE